MGAPYLYKISNTIQNKPRSRKRVGYVYEIGHEVMESWIATYDFNGGSKQNF